MDDVLAQIKQEEDKGKSGKKGMISSSLWKKRNVLQAEIAHAKSQIDLITRLKVDPVPAAYADDDARHYGFPDNDEGWAKTIVPMIERIKKECKPYLEAIEYNVMEYRLYRGMQGTAAPYMTGRVRLEGRKPQATGTHIHNAVNEYFTIKFGEPFRDALFTSSDANFAADYGNLFLVFPTGQFTFIWSEEVDDLYNFEHQMDAALEEDRDDENESVTNGYFGDTMDNLNYRSSGFTKAMESRQEIMIRTPVYYGINLMNFWKRNDYEDDSIGKMDDIVKAMRIIQGLIKE